MNPNNLGPRMRKVYLRHDRTTPPLDDDGDVDQNFEARGQFIPCGCCGKVARFGRTTVQDHKRRATNHFRHLLPSKYKYSPQTLPRPPDLPPSRRKVLVFSDSRQVAARLAPNLQMYSTRDSYDRSSHGVTQGFRMLPA